MMRIIPGAFGQFRKDVCVALLILPIVSIINVFRILDLKWT
ncbi:hypothetical protein [Mesorhizobium sp. Z1-4]|nr:hypothetical protein [Mesorhizobium sp. Z1-4]